MDHIGSQRDFGVFPMVPVGSLAVILVVAWKRGWLRFWIRFLCNISMYLWFSKKMKQQKQCLEHHLRKSLSKSDWISVEIYVLWQLKSFRFSWYWEWLGSSKWVAWDTILWGYLNFWFCHYQRRRQSSLIWQFRFLSVDSGSSELIRPSRRWLMDVLMQQYLPFQGQDGPSSLKELVLYLLLNSPSLDPSILDNLSASFQSYLHMKDCGKNGLMAVSED